MRWLVIALLLVLAAPVSAQQPTQEYKQTVVQTEVNRTSSRACQPFLVPKWATGLLLDFEVTDCGVTPCDLNINLQWLDALGAFHSIGSAAAVTVPGNQVRWFGPGADVAGGLIDDAEDVPLLGAYRCQIIHGNAVEADYTVTVVWLSDGNGPRP
jgi:hypothetical protein